MKFLITVSKPTAMPGELTTVQQSIITDDNTTGCLRAAIGRSTKAIDWRMRQVNERVLARTERFLKSIRKR